jgi:hypothetical protein
MKVNQMEKAAVVVLSFDRYSDLWPVYFECTKKFWNHNTKPTYLVTNEAMPRFDGVRVIPTGSEVSWSYRARAAVEKVDAEYILLMLEDYYFTSAVSDDVMESLFNYAKTNDVDYLRIYPFPKIHFSDKGVERIHPIPKDVLYGVNLQASIWKKEYLKKVLASGNYSAWEFEARQKNGAATQIQGKLYTVDYAPFEMVNGVLQGKWYTPAVKTLRNKGITVDTSKRNMLPWQKVFVYKLKIVVRKLAGPNLIRKFKPLLKRLGMKFVTE